MSVVSVLTVSVQSSHLMNNIALNEWEQKINRNKHA